MSDKPNILFIMSDEHDPGVTGCYGDPLVQTPNLDRLADRGVTFDACYCNSPLCVPSRLSWTAGKYVSRIGAWNNSCWLPSDDYPSVPNLLRRSGYTPYLCGKQHYDATRRYGFVDLEPKWNDHYKKGNISRREPDDESIGEDSWTKRSADFHPGDESGILDHDREVTKKANEFLSGYRNEQGPFLLFVGHLAPHFPLIAPEHIYEKYRGKVPMPEIPEGLIDRLPRNYLQHRRGFGETLADEETIQKGRDLYWALTDWYDGQIGQILDTLDDSEAAENTMVIYTSDHGENKGDHGLWWKNCAYEHAARVPLIVSYPARWTGGQRRTQACSLVDVASLVLEIGGSEVPEDWDGDAMAPWLDDGSYAWKDRAICEYYGHNIASGITMLREGKYKYVYHARMSQEFGPERELYDLEADPKELNNLSNEDEHEKRIERMHAELEKELGGDLDAIEQRCRAQEKYERED